MEFLCEDLPEHGLVLIPPSSPDYDALLTDIQRRLEQPVDGAPPIPEEFRPRISKEDRPTSAILLNRSPKAIAALHAIWWMETVTDRPHRHSRGMLSVYPLLLPFGQDESSLKLDRYWYTILPGSKRYLSESGMAGNNTDVRPPAPDEKWRGGMGGGGARAVMSGQDLLKRVTLALDGVFFIDGEFIGPDHDRLFEQTVADAEAHMLVAKTAREGHHRGLPAAQILAEIEKVTGPAPERPSRELGFRNPKATSEELRQAALQHIAFQLGNLRKLSQLAIDDRTVSMIMGWGEAILPHFRKRSDA